METTQHDSAYSWTRLAISLGLSVVGSIGMWAVIVVLPAMQADFGVSRSDATLPYIGCMLGFAAGNLMLGRAVDRWGITPVLAASAIAQAIGFALSALTPSIVIVSVLHLLLGLGAAASFSPLIADLSHWFLRRRGIAVAIAASGNYLAGTVWPRPIAWVMEGNGWQGAYLALAVLIVAVVLPGAFLLRRRIDEASTARATDAAASRAASIRISPRALQALLAVAGVSCCVAMSMPQVHIVALCIDRGFGPQAGAEMLSLMLAGGVVSRLAFGALSDRLGGLLVLAVGGTLQMLALSLFLVQGDQATLSLIALVFGLSQGGIVPAYAIIVREYMPPREAGRRVGLVMGATIIGMAFGGWVSGWLYDMTGSYAAAIWNGIAWNVLNITIALGILSRTVTPGRAVPSS
ncbi:MAG: MFS transporter [Silicimonas sp.]|jgi:MFS family permease|nr:MFS transporter [Silicimonas sp.]